jgi:anti-sigma factor RsiW
VSSGRWRISVTTPDWGHDHLSSDAIVAYVDEELAAGPHLRATRHLSQCPECAAQVVAQGQARAALRTAGCPSLPSSLLSSLRSIPQDTDLPAPPAGLAVTPDGQFVSVLRPERTAPGRTAPDRTDFDTQSPQDRPHRRMRLGAGVAVSGLAVGAIAFAVPGAVSGTAAPAPAPAEMLDRPILGGTATPVDARMQLAPAQAPTSTPPTPSSPVPAPGADGEALDR